MKPTTDEVLAWAREAGYTKVDPTKNPIEILERFATLAYAAGAKDMQERCAKVCEGIDADGWEVNMAEIIRALGDDDD